MFRTRVSQHLTHYLAQNTRATSVSTLKHYRVTFKQFDTFLQRRARLRDLTDENLAAFMRYICDKGRAVPTVNQKRHYICAFWRWCAKTGLVKRWPTVHAMPEPELIPDAWSLRDLARIFHSCKSQRGVIEGVNAANWWYSIHLFWYYHGERLGASLSAKWSDYDGETLLIPAANRKGRQKAMIYQLVPDVMREINKIRHPRRELIWPWKPGRCFWYQYRWRIIETAGVPYIRGKSGPQKMRRSYASHLEAAGGDATLGLRHSRSSLTRQSYIDPRIAKERNQSILLPKVG